MDYPLEAAALQWLRYDRQCVLLCEERTPLSEYWAGRPDVLGVDKGRHLIEIEVKRTLSDFRANARKRCDRQVIGADLPRQFYFLVPPEILKKVREELPARAGLLTVGDRVNVYTYLPEVEVVVRSPINREAKRLSLRAMALMVKHQAGTLVSLRASIHNLRTARDEVPTL